MKLLFWIALIGISYSYFLYPLILLLLPKRRNTLPSNQDYIPYISIIITAHNEENSIQNKIQNTLALDYPRQSLEIIVTSDASTDRTEQIVHDFKSHGVRLVCVKERLGKEFAQLQAIKIADGEILVFSDVATEIKKDSLKLIAKYFSNPKIGALSSEDRFVADYGAIVGEGAYVKYEMWLRNLESRIAGLVGLSGSFFAARKEVCLDWDIRVPSDFNTALNCVKLKYVAINAQGVYGFYANIKDEKNEYQRKLRTVIRGITALYYQSDVLNPFKYGLFSFQVWSHKIFRWLVPWFMILLLPVSFMLSGEGLVYILIILAQVIFYANVIAAGFSQNLRKIVLFRIPYYFIQSNMAIAHATIMFLSGKRITTWTPSKR